MFGNKYALIGNGYIGRRHIDAIKAVGGELAAVCDVDPSRAVDGVPFASRHQDLRGLAGWGDIGTVVVATPNHLHVPLAIWAAMCGKRVLVEKPFAISMQSLRKAAGLRDVYTVMQLRHHPLYREIMAADCREMDVLASVRRDEGYWNGWKGDQAKSGGIAFNLGIHYFDVIVNKFREHGLLRPRIEYKDSRKVEGSVVPLRSGCRVRFRVEITADGAGQERSVTLDGRKLVFSSQDNLSMEDLHSKVYEDMDRGEGVTPRDLFDLTRFVEKI
jgi:UDP-N-acetyl-2-amino-2-deoxyglucuronate dehydrogenase